MSTPKEFPRIVGFTGLAGAGKSTAARAVVATYPDFYRLSFADPLREMLAAIGVTPDDMVTGKTTPHLLLCGKTPRQALQTLGTEWGREKIGQDIWLNIANHRARQVLHGGGRVVFDDVRFDNEAKVIRDLGGVVIDLLHPAAEANRMAHVSEAGVDPRLIDDRILAADIEQLRARLSAFFNQFAPY